MYAAQAAGPAALIGTRLRGLNVVAPLAFMVSSLVIFWQDWGTHWKTTIPLAIGLVWFIVSFAAGRRDPGDVAGGVWLIAYIAFGYVLAFMGNDGGKGWIASPATPSSSPSGPSEPTSVA